MKLTYKDKVQIYELRKQGNSLKQLSNRFIVCISRFHTCLVWLSVTG